MNVPYLDAILFVLGVRRSEVEAADEADGVVTAWIVFETATGRGNGLLRLVTEDGEDRAFTLLTALYISDAVSEHH